MAATMDGGAQCHWAQHENLSIEPLPSTHAGFGSTVHGKIEVKRPCFHGVVLPFKPFAAIEEPWENTVEPSKSMHVGRALSYC